LFITRVTNAPDNAEEIQTNDGLMVAKFLEDAGEEIGASE